MTGAASLNHLVHISEMSGREHIAFRLLIG